MAFAVAAAVDLNEAHRQAMDLWRMLNAKQERKLICFVENSLNVGNGPKIPLRDFNPKISKIPLRYYDSFTYSEKCNVLRGSDAAFGDLLDGTSIGYIAWEGSIRIAAVTSFFVDVPLDLANVEPQYRKYARNVLIFKCYSLVSRQGANQVVVAARSVGGALVVSEHMAPQNVDFDFSRPDGGLSGKNLVSSMAEAVLSDAARADDLKNFAKNCFDTDRGDRRQSMSASCVAVNGQSYEIVANISGRFDCITDISIRDKI